MNKISATLLFQCLKEVKVGRLKLKQKVFDVDALYQDTFDLLYTSHTFPVTLVLNFDFANPILGLDSWSPSKLRCTLSVVF